MDIRVSDALTAYHTECKNMKASEGRGLCPAQFRVYLTHPNAGAVQDEVGKREKLREKQTSKQKALERLQQSHPSSSSRVVCTPRHGSPSNPPNPLPPSHFPLPPPAISVMREWSCPVPSARWDRLSARCWRLWCSLSARRLRTFR